jgi:hypothetical protein
MIIFDEIEKKNPTTPVHSKEELSIVLKEIIKHT